MQDSTSSHMLFDIDKDIAIPMTEAEIKSFNAMMLLPTVALADSIIKHRRVCPLCKTGKDPL